MNEVCRRTCFFMTIYKVKIRDLENLRMCALSITQE